MVIFIPRHFIILDGIVNEIVILISFSDFSLQVYRNTANLCRFILYPAFLLNLSLPLVSYFGFLFFFGLCWVFTVAHRFSLVSESGDYSVVVVRRLLIVVSCLGAEHGLWGAGASVAVAHGSVFVAPGLWSTGSVVVAHGLSCPSACGIFLDQGLNPCLLHLQTDSLLLSHRGSPTLDS